MEMERFLDKRLKLFLAVFYLFGIEYELYALKQIFLVEFQRNNRTSRQNGRKYLSRIVRGKEKPRIVLLELSTSSRITIFCLPSIDNVLQNSCIFVLSISSVPSVAHFTKSVSASNSLAKIFANVVFPMPCTPAKLMDIKDLFFTIDLKYSFSSEFSI